MNLFMCFFSKKKITPEIFFFVFYLYYISGYSVSGAKTAV